MMCISIDEQKVKIKLSTKHKLSLSFQKQHDIFYFINAR